MSVIDRVAEFLEPRVSRRSFIVRSAFAGSALSAGGVGYLLKPGTAYAAVCSCGSPNCSCSSTCCVGYTEFCCVMNGGQNICPSGTVMGGWWKADGSRYCAGPRYYMDCNATCGCGTGCGDGYQFCSTQCDNTTCGCAFGSCDNYLTGCFQFRYGQCNQDVTCIGRIVCRVVSCTPPWEIDPSCTTALAVDDNTANQTAACLTAPPVQQEDDDMPTAITGEVPAFPNPVVLAIPPPNGGAANWGQGWLSLASDFGSATVRVAIFGTAGWRVQDVGVGQYSGRAVLALETGDQKVSMVLASATTGTVGWMLEYAKAPNS